MENNTNRRRLIIILVYAIIFSAIALIIYLIQSPDPTCSDGKQNQRERGVDCGGPCSPCKDVTETKDLSVEEVKFLLVEDNTYDIVAKVSNPNNSFGAGTFKYVFNLKNETGASVGTSEGTSFILPADTRYVAKIGVTTSGGSIPTSAEFSISDVKWETLEGISKPQIGVYGKNFGIDPSGIGSKVEGTIRNESTYDLKKIEVVIVLRDERGDVIGINTTQRDSIRAKEQQNFQVTWPTAIEENVQKIEIDPQTNVFDSQNLSI